MNAQQYPKAITKIVIPRYNYVMLDADYSQIEYRVLVAMANEEALSKMFEDPDTDYHTLMASIMYGVPYASVSPKMRSDAKTFNFGIPYGMGFKSLAMNLTGMCGPAQVEEAKEKYELYFKDQPNVRRFFDQVKEAASVNKYTKTYWSRYRYYSFTDKDGNVSNAKKASALRQAGNACIQGCVSPDTLIQTREFGIVRIEDVVNYSGEVWDGDKWSHGDILYSGKKRKCVITFNTGKQFICSPIHKFSILNYVGDNFEEEGTRKFVECQYLKEGDLVECNIASSLSVHCKETNSRARSLTVKSVEITDKYIDMYDICNTDGGYYVADGMITHNTAADIFKISVARNFMWIRRNKLYGDVLISNMVHDEQLMEINCDKINTQRAAGDIIKNMEFKINGFPTLYVGAGFGNCWADAKGKMAEMHPLLAEQLTKESEATQLKISSSLSSKQILDYYAKRVYDFRFNRIKDYLENPENHGKPLYPVIGSMLELQFTYGLEKEFDGEALTKAALAKFIEVNNVNAKPEWFDVQEKAEEVEEEEEYVDEEDFDPDDLVGANFTSNEFAMIDESDKYYGITLQDIIKEFGLMVSKERRVCGIDITKLHYKKKDELVNFLAEHESEPEDRNAVEVVFLQENNVLYRTGVWVSGVDGSKLSARLGINALA